MDYQVLGCGILFLIVCVGIYGLCKRFRRKRNASPCLPKDEAALREILSRIYASTNQEDLQKVFEEGVRRLPRYRDLLHVATDEKDQEILQNSSMLPFEEKERRTKKTWLVIFFLMVFGDWLGVFYMACESSHEGGLSGTLMAATFLAILIGLRAWMLYHCSYKKKGTALLLFVLFQLPVQVLMPYTKKEMSFSVLDLPVFLFFGFFWISCLRLRRVNKEAKARGQIAYLKAAVM